MPEILNQLRWPSLARDLAILTVPDTPLSLDDVCECYDLTHDELKDVMSTPAFEKLFTRELENCTRAGDKAALRYRSATLGQALGEKLFRDAVDDKIEGRDAIRLLEIFMKAAGVMTPEAAAQVAVQSNVNVSLPLPHVPKLDHCFTPEVTEDV